MLRISARSCLIFATIGLALLILCVSSSWAGAAKDEICDADADTALGLEDYLDAIVLHRKILLAGGGDDALAHYHLSFAYGMMGDSSQEISQYLAATRLGLRKWDLFLNLGIAYLDRKDWPNAATALRAAVSLGPDHPEAHFNLVWCPANNLFNF
jgi:tetratricopeptide (TPR) repeat protein